MSGWQWQLAVHGLRPSTTHEAAEDGEDGGGGDGDGARTTEAVTR